MIRKRTFLCFVLSSKKNLENNFIPPSSIFHIRKTKTQRNRVAYLELPCQLIVKMSLKLQYPFYYTEDFPALFSTTSASPDALD